jgi:single-strand selective monofunctional uracil DNA glycosylase
MTTPKKNPARPGKTAARAPGKAASFTEPEAHPLVAAADRLAAELAGVRPAGPVSFIYNPLDYARAAHHRYLHTYGNGQKNVLFLGMNPGPFGMGQTGVPFGEVAAVMEWLGIRSGVTPPVEQHPKRPIEGFACKRSEVSGRRLWALFRTHQPDPDQFFSNHFVANYCPLLFLNERGANVTPDQLPRSARDQIDASCDRHLLSMIEILQPRHLVGVGDFARRCGLRVIKNLPDAPQVHSIIHPSPASPVANREWPDRPRRQLREAGIWA